MTQKVLLTWSGGKDSAMALYEIQSSKEYEIAALLTTITEDYDRVSMHGVPRVLVEQQAKSLGLPLQEVFISKASSNEEYEAKMKETLLKFKQDGISLVVFGDIFLQWVKEYRENNLAKLEMQGRCRTPSHGKILQYMKMCDTHWRGGAWHIECAGVVERPFYLRRSRNVSWR